VQGNVPGPDREPAREPRRGPRALLDRLGAEGVAEAEDRADVEGLAGIVGERGPGFGREASEAGLRNEGVRPEVPPRGVGSVGLSYGRIDNTGHRRTNGFLAERGQSIDVGLYIEGEYAFPDRFSVSAGLPYVFAKYTATVPPAAPIPYPPGDRCHCWNSGFQDFGFTARYNVVGGAFALTPSVSAGVPSRGYDYRGEAVVGRNLKEVRIAVDAGLRLDAISPRLSVQGRYSYAFVERVIDISNNRSNASAEAAFLLTRRFVARGLVSWQHTHGGLRFGSPPPADLLFPGDVNTPERVAEHDRLLQDNYWHVGGGVSYSFSRVDLFASYIAFVGGTDTHAGRSLTVGISCPFEIGHAHAP
jgi:hypothetical protein